MAFSAAIVYFVPTTEGIGEQKILRDILNAESSTTTLVINPIRGFRLRIPWISNHTL